MSIFETKRPETATESLDKKIRLKNMRRENMTALAEAAIQQEESDKIKKELDNMDDEKDKKTVTEAAVNSVATRRSSMLRNRALVTLEVDLVKKHSAEIYNQVLFEMVYNAFWLDDAVKENSDILAMYESFNSIKDLISKAIPQGKESKFICNVKSCVTEACKKAAKRVIEELDDSTDITDIDKIDFSLNDDENKELDDNLADLGKDEIEQLVKDKVLSVVQDEQQASKKKEEFIKDVDNKLTELDNTSAESPAAESATAIAKRNISNKMRRLSNGTVFETLMMSCNKDLRDEAITEGLSTSGPDFATAVLTDAIYRYTVIETFNTLGIYKVDNTNVRKLIDVLK